MDFKVDYIKVNEIGSNLEKENEDLISTLEDLVKIIEGLNESWQGVDYDNFKEVSTTYIKNLYFTTEELKYIGKFMQTASYTYQTGDEGWAKEVKQIGVDENWNKV